MTRVTKIGPYSTLPFLQGPRSKFSIGGAKEKYVKENFFIKFFLFNWFLFLQKSGGGGGLKPPQPLPLRGSGSKGMLGKVCAKQKSNEYSNTDMNLLVMCINSNWKCFWS